MKIFKPKKLHSKKAEKALVRFFLNIIVILVGFISAIYLGIFLNNKNLLEEEFLVRARAISESIVFARDWNARHGGVYVTKTPGMTSNPYLQNPDIEGKDGVVYTKKNPALMVREISETLEKEGTFKFRIISLNPTNPQNAPDSFEKMGLTQFQNDQSEVWTIAKEGDVSYFRYISPLLVQKACVECHVNEREGEIRGGISIRFSIDPMVTAMGKNMQTIIFLAIASFLALSLAIYQLVYKLRKRLAQAEEKLRYLAVTDELTELKNRRYLIDRLHGELKKMKRSGQFLSCIMFDLDHFKGINDTYGHEAGDRVLQAVATIVKKTCRENDVVCRSGGEEFIILLPETSGQDARDVAERLRQALAETTVHLPKGEAISFTASFGVVELKEPGDDLEKAEILLTRSVDEALYRAKENGRNRVEVYKY